jgi:cysteine desulfurase family protein
MDPSAHDLGDLVYLDNAATVFPKPSEVIERMVELYARYGVNPGRSGYDLCVVGGDLVEETRRQLAAFFGASDPERLCFASNASDALNILLQGLVRDGDHVLGTCLEHNSVLRPLHHLARDRGVRFDLVPCDDEGWIDPADVERRLRSDTRLVAINHGSNVIGTIQPVAEIGRICRDRGVLLLLDVAQTAGVVPIDVDAMGVDALAFTGHKSLLAPTGIGGLWVRQGVDCRPTRFGGTGVRSAEPFHLEEYPYRLEVGTPNVLGIFGLHAALEHLADRGVESIYRHEMELFARLQEGVGRLERVHLRGTTRLEQRLPVLSLTIDGLQPGDVGMMLDVEYGICCRTGLQCAPLIHERMGTAPEGTVRMSLGPATTARDIDRAIAAVTAVVEAFPRVRR